MVQRKCKPNAIKLALIAEVQPFLSKDTRQDRGSKGGRASYLGSGRAEAGKPFPRTIFYSNEALRCSYPRGVANDQWAAYLPEEPKLSRVEAVDREAGGVMLSVTGINRFYYLRDFTDMRCKHSRVLSIIREQLHHEPNNGDVFIVNFNIS